MKVCLQSEVKGKKKMNRKLNNLDVLTCWSLTDYFIFFIVSLTITLLFKLKLYMDENTHSIFKYYIIFLMVEILKPFLV